MCSSCYLDSVYCCKPDYYNILYVLQDPPIITPSGFIGHQRIAMVCVSYMHTHYPEVSTKKIDQIIEEPLCFLGKELQVHTSTIKGWTCNFDKTSVRL